MKIILAFVALFTIAAAPTPSEIEAAAPASAWVVVVPENLVMFETARGRFYLQLAPEFAPAHVAAVRAAVRRGAFAGGAVVRVQDNYVVQWSIAESKAVATPPVPPEFERPLAEVRITPVPGVDAYADGAGFVGGFPVAFDRKSQTIWLQHCYGMVGVGRGNSPDTGDGSELYAVIGHAPRHLDRNMAIVGRLIGGIESLSSLPRGTETLGFYKTEGERLAITGATMATDLPGAEQPRFEVMATDSPTFAAYMAARANRSDAFFMRPAGAVDACNVRVPMRMVKH